jgi:O-antigen ligase
MTPILYKLLVAAILLVFIFTLVLRKGNKNRQFIQYILYFFPFIAITLIPSIGYPNIFVLTILIFTLFFYRPRSDLDSSMKKYTYLLLLFLSALFLGGLGANSITHDSVRDFLQLLSVFVFVKIVLDEIIYDPNYFDVFIKSLNFIVFMSILFLGCQFIFGPEFSFDKTQNVNILQGNLIRYPSFFQDPQKYAQFLSASFFISLIHTSSRNTVKWSFYILPVMIIAALLFSGGRAGFLGLLLGVSLIVLLGNPRFRATIIITAGVILFISMQYADQMSIFNRESTFSDAYDFRFEIWNDAYEIFKTNPFLGIGIGNYATFVSIHNPDQYWVASNVYTAYDHPESGYLKLLVEFGIFGFILFFSFILIPIVKGITFYLNTKDHTTLLLIAALLSWMVGFTTVYSLSDSRILIYIAVITLLLIIRYKNNLVNESI